MHQPTDLFMEHGPKGMRVGFALTANLRLPCALVLSGVPIHSEWNRMRSDRLS
jgi:hypothetical protein